MFSKLALITAALAALSQAVPTTSPTPSFTYISLMKAYSADTTFNDTDINFSGGRAYIGKPTSTICPSGTDCSKFANVSAISVDMDTGSREAIAASAVQPNQFLYLTSTGELAYTAPGDAVPTDAIKGAFTRYEAFSSSGSYEYNFYEFLGEQWRACPTEQGASTYLVSNTLGNANPDGCVEFTMRSGDGFNNRTSTAYEYAL